MAKNSLAKTHPELAKEWHPTKNEDLTPEDVTAGVNKKVWWLLPYDDPKTGKHFEFEWQATVNNRTNGRGCPFLSGKAVWKGFNDLATTNPELAKEWHPTKNEGLTPEDVTEGANINVWWFLPYDDVKTGMHFEFEWQAHVNNRSKGTGCPYLIGQAVWKGYNDLATTNPELAKEWHPTKNGNLLPQNITEGSNRSVWWYLPYDDPITGKHFNFEWQATVYNRVSGQMCPFISGHAVWEGYNDLATTNPELVVEWHPTKNAGLTPKDFTAGSKTRVWWYLSYDDPKTGKHCDFEWQASISSRTRGSGCPFLSNQKVRKNCNDLATTNPELAKEWHPLKNGKLKPEDVSAGSEKMVWWLLPYDDPKTGKHFEFEWQALVYNRVLGKGCPFLSGREVWKGYNDLATTNPELAREWHPTKNGTVTPDEVTAGSGENVWWYLPYDDPKSGKHFDFEWQATVSSRSAGTGCPYLVGKAIWKGYNDLATTNPEIAAEWHPTKNGDLTPYNVMAGSGKKVWWYLPYDDPETGMHFNFEWEAYIKHRANGDSSCPFLSGHAVWKGYNDLATVYPQLAAEWHPTKNGSMTPDNTTIGSGKKAWWYLSYDDPKTGKHFDFEWEAYIAHRVKGSGCPFLSNQAVWKGYNDFATTNPELAREWHPTKNGNITPNDITNGYDQRVWWLLPYNDPKTGKHFDFEWQVRIADRIRGDGCPFLSNQLIWKGYNDLATTNPEIAAEWHPTKNKGLTPDEISAGSERKIWWLLPYDDPKTGKHFDFEWQACVYHRVGGMGCPFISGKAVWKGYNDLATTNPEIASQWHPTKNGKLSPEDVSIGSNIKVWWYLPYDDSKTGKHFDFEWQAIIVSRGKGAGCPFLSNQAVWKGFNDLATTNPEIAAEWHPTKNGKLNPSDVTAGANKKAWWICSNNHVWKAALGDRKNGRGCPLCNETRGERRVREVLSSIGVPFKAQYSFEGMKHINPLKCDFAILDSECNPIGVIEYNGEQHYEPVDFAGKGERWAKKVFETTKERDRKKALYLEGRRIPMLEIPYWEYDSINKLVQEFLADLSQ